MDGIFQKNILRCTKLKVNGKSKIFRRFVHLADIQSPPLKKFWFTIVS